MTWGNFDVRCIEEMRHDISLIKNMKDASNTQILNKINDVHNQVNIIHNQVNIIQGQVNVNNRGVKTMEKKLDEIKENQLEIFSAIMITGTAIGLGYLYYRWVQRQQESEEPVVNSQKGNIGPNGFMGQKGPTGLPSETKIDAPPMYPNLQENTLVTSLQSIVHQKKSIADIALLNLQTANANLNLATSITQTQQQLIAYIQSETK